MLEFFFIFSFQRVNIKMEDGSKTPGGMSTVSGPGAGGPGAGGPNLAIKQPMIYICGECHAGMVTKAFLWLYISYFKWEKKLGSFKQRKELKSIFSDQTWPLHAENEIEQRDPIRCRDCGHRILYKKKTKRLIVFDAR